jgi:hypothetical protein
MLPLKIQKYEESFPVVFLGEISSQSKESLGKQGLSDGCLQDEFLWP